MKVFVVTHSSEEWKTINGVYSSLEAVHAYYEEEDRFTEENKLRWYNEYEGAFELPMNSFPIRIDTTEWEIQ